MFGLAPEAIKCVVWTRRDIKAGWCPPWRVAYLRMAAAWDWHAADDGATAKRHLLAQGVPRKRIEQLVACIGRVPGIDLADLDISLSPMLPGDAVFRRPHGLALCMAIVSTFLRRPSSTRTCSSAKSFVPVRSGDRRPAAACRSSAAAIMTGEIGVPVRIICPGDAAVCSQTDRACGDVPVETLDDAIRAHFTSLATEGPP